MINFKNIFLIFFISFTPQVFGQAPFIKAADRLYEASAYSEASGMYLTLLQEEYNYGYNTKLAECYRKMGQPAMAEYWYAILVNQPSPTPEAIFNYAQLLKANGKYKTAKEWFLKYANYNADGYYYAGTCDWAFENEGKNVSFALDTININTTGSDISPAFYKNGIVYASTGNIPEKNIKNNYLSTGLPYYDIYDAKQNAPHEFSGIEKLPGDVNSKMHEAAVCFNPVSGDMYFTRNNYYKGRQKKGKDGAVKLELYTAEYADGKWKKVKPFSFNTKNYSVGQPTISSDGNIIIFVSDMPGGFGGTDLYYAQSINGNWTTPINLGETINTKGNEMFPYLSADNILYFSSNYHPGFGGLDIFFSSRENDHWKKPENMGSPINSSRDDFGFIFENGKGYFSSDRIGGVGSDDIYAVTQLNSIKSILINDGDAKPVAGAYVTLLKNGAALQTETTNENGMLPITITTQDNYAIKITKAGYLDITINNIDLLRTNNGIYPVIMQPLVGYKEIMPDTQNTNTTTTDISNTNTNSSSINTNSQQSNAAADSSYSYAVQIGVYKNPDYSKLAQLANVGELDVKAIEDGSLLFSLVNFETLEAALAAKEEAIKKGFADAFILTFIDGIQQK